MLDRGIKKKRDTTDYSSPVDHDRQLKRLRFLHRYVPPETPWETIAGDILDRAKPELPSRVASDLEKIEQYLKNGEKELSKEKYKDLVKQALGVLSPETLAEYEKHGIEFVLNEDISYPTTREIGGHKQLHLPTKYEYPVKCMILRCVDEILKVKLEGTREIVQDLAMRVEITTRVFQTNMMLMQYPPTDRAHEENLTSLPTPPDVDNSNRTTPNLSSGFAPGKYGWDIKGYELAEQYHADYQDGIRKAFEEGLMNKNASKDNLMQTGNKYANRKLLDSIMPTKDVPRIFPSVQPGAYFEELNIKEREIKHKKPIIRFLAKEPVKLGTDSSNELVKDIKLPKDKEEYSLFNVVILPNKEIWVLPLRFPEGQKSQHSIVAKGNPCAWAGEVKIKGNKIISINDKSGHYKTHAYPDDEQTEIDTFALETFRQHGYDVLQAIEHTAKRYNSDLASLSQSQNEKDSQQPARPQ